MRSPLDSRQPDWRLVLLVVCIAHCAATTLMRVVPVLGPDLIVNHGWTPELIGHVSTIANVGSVGFVLIGAGVFRHLGSARGILLGLGSGVAGLAMLAVPAVGMPLLAGILIGFSHAPSHPVGNDLLQNHSPQGHRSLIFSIKLSAPALGGVLSGLVLPAVALTYGLYTALVTAAIPLLIGALALIPLYGQLRALDAQTTRNGGMFNMRNVTGPMRTVMLDPTLRSLAMTGFILSLVHSAWLVYLPTYLSVEIGIPPIVSGYIFAVLQTGAFLGRLMLGWGADKILTPRSVLVWALIGTAVTTCILPAIAPYSNGLVLGILALITGIAAAGWSGVQVAEVMRLAKPDSLIDAASGVMVTTGAGVIIGPLLFPFLINWTGSWEAAFASLAIFPVLAVFTLIFRRRSRRV
ncbi:MFS transporter [Aquamicrobium zhengzhouense]|uniref:MFS transporter n=1 Tax=Aquamicrobium zhengzhouense TaxID=2781738 RepID=A0ABS0SGH5_9HYPH|nr:MFS transporter [Aquamicrobium zhengzhouense]MBI1622407.1 MFS transporter [Aquamicrobium zhengzhouense]